MSQLLTVVKAGFDYNNNLLYELGDGVRRAFGNHFTAVDVHPLVFDFTPSITSKGELSLWILYSLADYLEQEVPNSRILCLTKYPIMTTDGFAPANKKTVFVSSARDYMSPRLPTAIVLKRWLSVSLHEKGHSIGSLDHHEYNGTKQPIGQCPMYPLKDSYNAAEFLDTTSLQFCSVCNERLGV